MKLTVLMPCLNEAETIATCIDKAQGWIARSVVDAEVLVADNGSTDGSQEIARAHGARVVDVLMRGYGSALFHGSQAARGRYIIMGDADDSYDFGDLDAFVDRLDAGADLVMGNRFRGGIAPGAMPWKNRYLGNPVLSWVGRTMYGITVGDFHCGMRGYTREAFDRMDLRTTGMEFASEMVIKASLSGMRIDEVPTTLSRDGRSRPPHLRPWRDGWRHLRFMSLLSPRWLFLVPGAVVTLAGLLVYAILILGSVRVGSVRFDVHTLLFSQTAIVLGYCALALGLIVRLFAMREGLLAHHELLDRVRRSPVLEAGSAVGTVIFLAGVAIGSSLVARWGGRGWGDLRAEDFLRSISVATLLLLLGGLTVLFSLIMGFLSLPTRNERWLPRPPTGPAPRGEADPGPADSAWSARWSRPDRAG